MTCMCVVSAVGDTWQQGFPERWPNVIRPNSTTYIEIPVSRQEFEALKAELEALKKVLKEAKLFDEATGQPDCEVDEKVGLIKALAEALDVDLEDIFGE